jgi:phosphate uptake regulator
LDDRALQLLALQQPMAVDLRFITATMKSTVISNAWATGR